MSALYRAQALSLIRLAHVMLGDRGAAEDVVQDAFAGLHRRRLPERQRETLVLRFYMDEPGAEIARLMGIGESTVRSTTHRALASLGRMLEEES